MSSSLRNERNIWGVCPRCLIEKELVNQSAPNTEPKWLCYSCEPSDYSCFNQGKRESRERKRTSMENVLKKNKLIDRSRFINEGTVVVDDKYTYYCQKKIAKVKGNPKRYQMRGVQHFIDTFIQKGHTK